MADGGLDIACIAMYDEVECRPISSNNQHTNLISSGSTVAAWIRATFTTEDHANVLDYIRLVWVDR